MTLDVELAGLAYKLVDCLKRSQHRIVFSESCTAGMLAFTLSQIPGVSDCLCGSAVTYRNETKAEWLNVSRDLLSDPKIGAVSSQVAKQMCIGVLEKTPEADIAVSITGHLGPHAPLAQDGLIYVGVVQKYFAPHIFMHQLNSQNMDPLKLRQLRQLEAAQFAFKTVLEQIQKTSQRISPE